MDCDGAVIDSHPDECGFLWHVEWGMPSMYTRLMFQWIHSHMNDFENCMRQPPKKKSDAGEKGGCTHARTHT